jgi:hypothetical protein
MLIFQPPVNFCSDENIQTIFGTNLEHFLNYRIDYNSISQTIEKVVKKIFFSAPKASKSGNRQVLVEPWPTKSELRCAYYGRNKAQIFNGAIDSANLKKSTLNQLHLLAKWKRKM